MVTPFFPGQQQINPRSRFRTPPVKMHGIVTFQTPSLNHLTTRCRETVSESSSDVRKNSGRVSLCHSCTPLNECLLPTCCIGDTCLIPAIGSILFVTNSLHSNQTAIIRW